MTIPVIRDLTIFLIDSALSACLICIGSNDHRKENLLLARQNLYALFPSIYFATEMETEPLYLKNTARFSNQVALFVTAMEKEAVVNALKEIEMKAGRRPEDKTEEKIPLSRIRQSRMSCVSAARRAGTSCFPANCIRITAPARSADICFG